MGSREPSSLDIDEVHRMGGRRSRARNADQTAAAVFWSGNPLVPWMRVTEALTADLPPDGPSASRVLSTVASALSESLAMAAGLKVMWHAPRPQDWIRGSAAAANAKRRSDPAWEPLLGAGHGSEYPCEGCMAAGAAVGALRTLLGTDRAVLTLTGPWEDGLTRDFQSFTQMLQESEDARVWGGLHFRATAVESTELGLRLGEAAGIGHNSPWPPLPPPPPGRTAS